MNPPRTPRSIQPDPAFGANGRLLVQPPGNLANDLTQVTTDAGGQLLAYGNCRVQAPDKDQAGVCRLLDNGDFDIAFGRDGNGFVSIPDVPDLLARRVSSLRVMADGSFFIAGDWNRNDRLVLLHYSAQGIWLGTQDIDASELNKMPFVLRIADRLMIVTALARQGLLYRRHADGSRDSDFGEDGKRGFLTVVQIDNVVASQQDTAFYIACRATGDEGVILRLDLDGQPDPSFGENGVYRTAIDNSRSSHCHRLLEQADGRLVAVIQSVGLDNALACHLMGLTHDGRPDPGFNHGMPVPAPGFLPEDLALQADGKCLLVCRHPATGNFLARYRPDGSPDPQLGDDGSGTLPIVFDPGTTYPVKSVMVQGDGKIVVGGVFGSGTALLRFIEPGGQTV